MKILLLGKFPPVQGGTAVQTLWLCRGLMRAGATVTVVDSSYVYRPEHLANITDDDWTVLSEVLPEFRSLSVRKMASDRHSASAIPNIEPLVTRLVNEVLLAVDASQCDAIVASYVEPYGVAGMVASDLTGVPMAFMHAGSDITRLASSPGRRSLYGRVLSSADLVLSSPRGGRLALQLGARAESLVLHRPILTPRTLFEGQANNSAESARAWIDKRAEYGSLLGSGPAVLPVVTMYGKFGERKGTYALVRAAQELRRQGHEFRLLFVGDVPSPASERLIRELTEADLAESSAVLPFIAPWQVPKLLAASDVVCFLENRFPVEIHRPQVPREVATAGVCLVLSQDVASYQATRSGWGRAFPTVGNPDNAEELAGVLGALLQDQSIRAERAQAGTQAYGWPTDDEQVEWCESILARLTESQEAKHWRSSMLERFQDVAIRSYADSTFRQRVRDHPEMIRDDVNLTDIEADTLLTLLAQRELDRYCRSLLVKKYSFLSRVFRETLRRFERLDGEIRSEFHRTWVLHDEPLEQEFRRFADLVVAVGKRSSQIDDSRLLEAWTELTFHRAVISFGTLEPSGLLPANSVRLTESARLVQLPIALDAPSEPAAQGPWWLALWPAVQQVDCRQMSVSREIFAWLGGLQTPTPIEQAVDVLTTRANGASPEECRRVVLSLVGAGLLERGDLPEPIDADNKPA